MRDIVTNGVEWSVYLSVCLSRSYHREPCKTAEPIEMSYSPGGSNVSTGEGTLAPPGEYD